MKINFGNNSTTNAMKIYKYHTININLLNSLRNKTNWYSKLSYLNDPYECLFIDNTNTTVYKNLVSTLSVCCFSRNMNNILMWSHYADSHRGVCLEWEIDEEAPHIKGALNPITYDNKLVTLEEVKITKEGYLDLNVGDNGKFIFQKLKYWEYEEEMRIYNIDEDPNSNPRGKSKEFLGKLTSIYFGKNVIKDTIELVKFNTSHIPNLKYYKVDLNTDEMEYNNLTQL
ncbi:DUF2971 domain-containing protein [Dysgonomonas gadei]|uniref:DUF2971 domain-containing protein n=1 Tax=Dysgonomonas gadei ATCC BAA-286 TaxID=742766 RepID=F5IVF5_9BACT|nr:DUF2971 domain-containing protein [Dysgonomonas gadei]EGK02605.1 hypothetical protein HMPREF9455_00855 [Dysgonomonas gadei ATCC BAA-286]